MMVGRWNSAKRRKDEKNKIDIKQGKSACDARGEQVRLTG
jgi:hypothetical protein